MPPRTLAAVALVIVAGATPAARADCKRVGPSAVEVTRETAGKATETITLWTSGAWAFVQPPPPGEPAATAPPEVRASGCLDPRVASALAQDLAAVDWTVIHPRIRCRAKSPASIEYATGGRHRLGQTLCGPEQLDDHSTELLSGVVAVLDAATRTSHRPARAQVARPPSTPALPADPQQPPTEIAP